MPAHYSDAWVTQRAAPKSSLGKLPYPQGYEPPPDLRNKWRADGSYGPHPRITGGSSQPQQPEEEVPWWLHGEPTPEREAMKKSAVSGIQFSGSLSLPGRGRISAGVGPWTAGYQAPIPLKNRP